jgi:hypothetical protein
VSSTWAIEEDGTRTYEEYISPIRRTLLAKAEKNRAAKAMAAVAAAPKKKRVRIDRRDTFQKMKPHERLEMAMDRAAVNDLGRFEVAALADNECQHGALPGDPVLTCACWGAHPTRAIDIPFTRGE